MAENETLFDLPNTPEEFGVTLSPSNLRTLDFSGLDYTTARRAIIEYIRTYFPEEFNDFVASNGIIMLMEILASTVGKMSLRGDLLVNESFLPTASTERAVSNHLALINQRIRRQTPAIIDVECTVDSPLFTDLHIPAGTDFQITGPDNQAVFYEIYRAPNDWVNEIIIPANKRGVIAWGIEGRFVEPATELSSGGPRQQYIIVDDNILESPIFVTVAIGDDTEDWTVISEPIERYGPNDKVVEVNFFDNRAIFLFGDDVTGQAPKTGSTISFRYRVGGGRRGRIGAGIIDTQQTLTANAPSNVAQPVRFRNVAASTGGTDKESLENAKRRAPRDFAVRSSIATSSDYAQAAESFSHPSYGSVSKSLATIRTSLNANLVEIYVLAEGPDDTPVKPNAGLKAALDTFFSDLNVLTDHLAILDGEIKPVDVELNIIVDRNADASVVKDRVENTITEYFDVDNWELGQPFYVSNFVEALERVDGVKYVDLFDPVNNILPTREPAGTTSTGIGINELIVLGNRNTNYYYDKANTGLR
jgi:phage-related baseplate assembly protein